MSPWLLYHEKPSGRHRFQILSDDDDDDDDDDDKGVCLSLRPPCVHPPSLKPRLSYMLSIDLLHPDCSIRTRAASHWPERVQSPRSLPLSFLFFFFFQNKKSHRTHSILPLLPCLAKKNKRCFIFRPLVHHTRIQCRDCVGSCWARFTR